MNDSAIMDNGGCCNLEGCRFLVGSEKVFAAKPRPCLSEDDRDLLAGVATRLMANPEARQFPDVISFAFWCRKAQTNALALRRGAEVSHRVGRGLAFHIAPSNVPVNFAFSWAFALLAGNANIVRVPSKPWPQIALICDAIREELAERNDTRNAFVSYQSSSSVTAKLSARADARIIWGGDRTVASIRSLPSKPRCVDIAFSDRFSLAIIDGAAIMQASDQELDGLAKSFFDDTYLMDQNACSSPMVIAWMQGSEEAKARFWGAVRNRAVQDYDLQGAVVTDKYVKLCEDAIDGVAVAPVAFDGWLDVIALPDGFESLTKLRGKGGYFYELDITSLDQLLCQLDESCQTITYFGVSAEDIRDELIAEGSVAVDRIVPMGKAMDIDIVWDGMDLLNMLSRLIDVR